MAPSNPYPHHAEGYYAWSISIGGEIVPWILEPSKSKAITALTLTKPGDSDRRSLWRDWKTKGARPIRVYVESVARISRLESIAVLARQFAEDAMPYGLEQQRTTLRKRLAILDNA
ncbi:MAG: hypothetical protein AAF170_14190 [Bacteroidota bacterium]